MLKKKREYGFKPVFVVLMIFMVLSLSACKSREPITASVFQDKLERLEYEIADVTDQYTAYDHIQGVIVTEKGSVHIEFFEADSKDNAAAMFNGNKQTVEGYKSGGTRESSISTGGYQRYSLTTGESFYTIVQVENTLIYARCDKADKETLEGVITDLGY